MTDRRRWRSRRPGPQNHHTIARGRAAEFLARPAPTGAMHPPGGRASARAPHCSAAYVFLSRRCRRLLPFEMLQCKLSSRRRGARFGGRGCWRLSGSKCARVVARQVWRRQLKHDLWATACTWEQRPRRRSLGGPPMARPTPGWSLPRLLPTYGRRRAAAHRGAAEWRGLAGANERRRAHELTAPVCSCPPAPAAPASCKTASSLFTYPHLASALPAEPGLSRAPRPAPLTHSSPRSRPLPAKVGAVDAPVPLSAQRGMGAHRIGRLGSPAPNRIARVAPLQRKPAAGSPPRTPH